MLRVFVLVGLAAFATSFSLESVTAEAQNSNVRELESVLPNFDPLPSLDRLAIEFPKAFGSFEEQWALEDAIIAELKQKQAGTFDGPLQAVDGSFMAFYIYSHDVKKAIEAVTHVLRAKGYASGIILETTQFLEDGTTSTVRTGIQ